MPVVRSYNPTEGGSAVWVDGPIVDPAMALRLARQLDDIPAGDGPADIVVASGGGDCALGLELHAIIAAHPRRIRTTVLYAGSMAVIVALAAAERRIVEGGTLFLHNVGFSGSQVLQAFDDTGHHAAVALRKMARRAEAADAAHVALICRATGLPAADVRALRDADTKLGADAALKFGFVHEIVEARP